MLPSIDFFGTKISRLLLGDNPFVGNTYVYDLHSRDEMLDYYTCETVLKTMFAAEENGITAYLALADPFILRIIREYRKQGGKMNIIFQSYAPVDLETGIWQMMECEPIGIYHQGSTFDLMVEEEKFDLIHKRLGMLKATGVKVGFATHVPETLLKAEEEDWGMDFYTTSIYNSRQGRKGETSSFITGKPKQLAFYPGDPPLMYEAIKKVNKTCICIKILAGGQILLELKEDEIQNKIKEIYKEVFENIKAIDVICVGVFPKYKDQIKENVNIINEILS